MLQLASLRPTDNVLDVACGTGYSSVVLGRLVKSVTALEQDADLVRIASDMVPASGAANVTVVQGGLTEGVKARAPFDAIVIKGAVEAVPEQLLAQLAEGGRLVADLRERRPGPRPSFSPREGPRRQPRRFRRHRPAAGRISQGGWICLLKSPCDGWKKGDLR